MKAALRHQVNLSAQGEFELLLDPDQIEESLAACEPNQEIHVGVLPVIPPGYGAEHSQRGDLIGFAELCDACGVENHAGNLIRRGYGVKFRITVYLRR